MGEDDPNLGAGWTANELQAFKQKWLIGANKVVELHETMEVSGYLPPAYSLPEDPVKSIQTNYKLGDYPVMVDTPKAHTWLTAAARLPVGEEWMKWEAYAPTMILALKNTCADIGMKVKQISFKAIEPQPDHGYLIVSFVGYAKPSKSATKYKIQDGLVVPVPSEAQWVSEPVAFMESDYLAMATVKQPDSFVKMAMDEVKKWDPPSLPTAEELMEMLPGLSLVDADVVATGKCSCFECKQIMKQYHIAKEEEATAAAYAKMKSMAMAIDENDEDDPF